MKVNDAARASYDLINAKRVAEQVQIQHCEHLKHMRKLADIEAKRLKDLQADCVAQAREAYLGKDQKNGHNITMNHVDVYV
jgi:hypothetical protein